MSQSTLAAQPFGVLLSRLALAQSTSQTSWQNALSGTYGSVSRLPACRACQPAHSCGIARKAKVLRMMLLSIVVQSRPSALAACDLRLATCGIADRRRPDGIST